jgi:NitT/TauT family transport system substrate-binding protein
MRRRFVVLLAVCVVAAAACGSNSTGSNSAGSAGSSGHGDAMTLRLGFFPNITHGTALVGVDKGIFATKLGPGVTLKTATFNAGPNAIDALFSGSIDATYVGPNPAINGFVKSKGAALRIVAGATSGGAALVVKPDINGPADLKGKTLATPQLGNTQDIALRTWLAANGLKANASGGGDVSIKPEDNAITLTSFEQNQIQGAWVPEPWATRLVLEGKGKVLVNEADLWPKGQFVTTVLVVRTDFLKAHPDVVRGLIEGEVATNDYIAQNPVAAQTAANDEIEKITQKRLSAAVVAGAWKNLDFTNDPVASSLRKVADNATALGLLPKANLNGIYDLTILNQVLQASGQATVAGDG